jgi:hypothetical protein
MLSADEAAILARVSPRVIYSWIEADKIHFSKPRTADSHLLQFSQSFRRGWH